jgi:hypothetical protein
MSKREIKKKDREKPVKFKDIVVSEKFKINNGLLWLDRDIYLSLVKYLDSTTVRKVLLNIFVLFIFLFF